METEEEVQHGDHNSEPGNQDEDVRREAERVAGQEVDEDETTEPEDDEKDDDDE